MRASVDCAGRSRLQYSQFGLISSAMIASNSSERICAEESQNGAPAETANCPPCRPNGRRCSQGKALPAKASGISIERSPADVTARWNVLLR
jgi:hypothetical protein